MESSNESSSAPGLTRSLRLCTGRTGSPKSAFAAALIVGGLVSALFVAQVMAASLGAATRHAGSPKPVEPGPHRSAPPVTDLGGTDVSDPVRLDIPLPVDTDESDGAPQLPDPDVALVSWSTAGDLPVRAMPYEEFAANAERMLDLLPTLDMLQTHVPVGVFTDDIERQKEHIRALDEAAEVTREGFESFVVHENHRAYVPPGGHIDRIDPKMFIIHWTGGGYEDPNHFLRVMGRLRVQYFIDKHARVHGLFEAHHEKPAHALGANDFSQGVEIETGHFDGVNSPLFGYTAEQITQTVYLAVDFLRRNDLPVDRTTILGHYAADLIFTNPYYDPYQGTFSQGRIRKFDPPEELMAVIINKAQSLDRALTREHAAQLASTEDESRCDESGASPAVSGSSAPERTLACDATTSLASADLGSNAPERPSASAGVASNSPRNR